MYSLELDPTDKWWSSITTSQKEHIAKKLLFKQEKEKGASTPDIDYQEYAYPRCTVLWNSLDQATKEKVRRHCEISHDFVEHEEQDGWMFSE